MVNRYFNTVKYNTGIRVRYNIQKGSVGIAHLWFGNLTIREIYYYTIIINNNSQKLRLQ